MVTTEQVRLRILFDAAITRHYRSLLDAARTTPALLDDLVAVAETYATEHARRVTARQALRAEAAVPLSPSASERVIADPATPLIVAAPVTEVTETPAGTTSHRTRTRTRRTAD